MTEQNLEHQLIFAFLPEGLSEWFDLDHYEKTDTHFRIYLIEKNIPPDTDGKQVINTVLKKITIDDYPIRGRKAELIVSRRYWKLEGVAKLLKRDIKITEKNTRLAIEFANFLKEEA